MPLLFVAIVYLARMNTKLTIIVYILQASFSTETRKGKQDDRRDSYLENLLELGSNRKSSSNNLKHGKQDNGNKELHGVSITEVK
jgi:hypothetical protein